jgi:magnesium-transporting ATPase (P-type)
MAGLGLRVLAFARGSLPQGHTRFSDTGVPGGLTFLGLQAMIDPPRPEVIAAVSACARAGIMVKMITGDHAKTADAIAHELNLQQTYGSQADLVPVVTGKVLSDLSDEALTDTIEKTLVFARVAPEQKLRLVEALQERHHVVAMTGDGVNDAPALKQADIGIAMGITGTEVAKEASDMLLTDDNFATIEAAVEEGRGVFDNLTKFITWTLPTNGGEGLIILAAVLAGVQLPILPLQILWINMTTAVLLGMMLAFEPKEAGLMNRNPRKPGSPILTQTLLVRIALVSLVMMAGAFTLYELALRQGSDISVARTIAVNVFVMIELCYLFQCRSLTRSVFKIKFFSNPWIIGGSAAMILLQLGFTYLPLMNRLFRSAPLSYVHWLQIAAACCVTIIIVSLHKIYAARTIRHQ